MYTDFIGKYRRPYKDLSQHSTRIYASLVAVFSARLRCCIHAVTSLGLGLGSG